MASGDEFSVHFWGVRGSIACPGPDTVRYGGNTPCVEVRCGERVLVFDAGTGMRNLGEALIARGVADVDLFYSHSHLDHINGFPFFRFAFEERNRLKVWAGHLLPDHTIESVIRSFMSAPIFPVPVDAFHAATAFSDFNAGDTLTPHDGISIRTAPLNHPNRATGYRVEYGGKSICYVTDTEHVSGQPDKNVIDLIRDADIVIYDGMFTDEEYKRHVGWGHSTWQECLRICQGVGVKTPVIFHHLPGRTDSELDDIAAEAAKICPGAIVAEEGATLTP